MAARLQLSTPRDGMHFIWNVSQHVGDHTSCANQRTDVELVSIIMAEVIRLNRPAWLHQSIRQGILANGDMDVNTAFWIRVFNSSHRPRLNREEEGRISPARGAGWAGDTWTILKLNGYLNYADARLWQDLPNHPNVSPALKRELEQ